jgi:5-methylthioribose kinase
VVIRRLVGLSHVADMDGIQDPDLRAGCERRALGMGRRLLVQGARGTGDVAALVAAAAAARQ